MFDGAASCSLSLRAARVLVHKHRPYIVWPSVDSEKTAACRFHMSEKEKKKGAFRGEGSVKVGQREACNDGALLDV